MEAEFSPCRGYVWWCQHLWQCLDTEQWSSGDRFQHSAHHLRPALVLDAHWKHSGMAQPGHCFMNISLPFFGVFQHWVSPVRFITIWNWHAVCSRLLDGSWFTSLMNYLESINLFSLTWNLLEIRLLVSWPVVCELHCSADVSAFRHLQERGYATSCAGNGMVDASKANSTTH